MTIGTMIGLQIPLIRKRIGGLLCHYWVHPSLQIEGWLNLNSAKKPICEITVKEGMIEYVYKNITFVPLDMPESFFEVSRLVIKSILSYSN
jgi:hypothetical protein